jgi:hypothetical protein
VSLHADAIAQDRAARERARGVDRDDGDALALLAEGGDEPSVSVLLPAPGTPVTPMVQARPVWGNRSLSTAA